MHDVFFPIKEQLALVQGRIDGLLNRKTEDVEHFTILMDHTESLCPSMVIFAAKIYGTVTEKVLSLAEIMQVIFLASIVHRNVNEDSRSKLSSDPESREDCRYPVLAGDYLYGRFFTALCAADMVHYLEPLAQLICRINEGAVTKLKNQMMANPSVKHGDFQLEYAEMLAGCCLLGGKEAGADSMQQQNLLNFGFSLGMALGISEHRSCDRKEKLFKEALHYLEGLTPGKSRDDIQDVIMYFMENGLGNKKMVC